MYLAIKIQQVTTSKIGMMYLELKSNKNVMNDVFRG